MRLDARFLFNLRYSRVGLETLITKTLVMKRGIRVENIDRSFHD